VAATSVSLGRLRSSRVHGGFPYGLGLMTVWSFDRFWGQTNSGMRVCMRYREGIVMVALEKGSFSCPGARTPASCHMHRCSWRPGEIVEVELSSWTEARGGCAHGRWANWSQAQLNLGWIESLKLCKCSLSSRPSFFLAFNVWMKSTQFVKSTPLRCRR
jgi:hypothetical protein